MSFDESAFLRIADETLATIFDAIDDQLADCLDIDDEGGVVTIELDAGGTFIINKHAPNKQIWLSSPVSGASHYDWNEAAQKWVSTRGGDDLLTLLERELSEKTGSPFGF